MQFLFTAISVASLAAIAQAASAEFGIVLGATGTQYQHSSVGVADSKLKVGSESTFTVEDDGSLKSQDGLYVSVGGDGVLAAGSSASSGWAIKGGYLVYGTDGFYVADGYLTTTAPSSTERLVGLLPYDSTGKVVPDFAPGGSASSAAATSAAATSAAAKTTAAVVSQIGDGQIQATTSTAPAVTQAEAAGNMVQGGALAALAAGLMVL